MESSTLNGSNPSENVSNNQAISETVSLMKNTLEKRRCIGNADTPNMCSKKEADNSHYTTPSSSTQKKHTEGNGKSATKTSAENERKIPLSAGWVSIM